MYIGKRHISWSDIRNFLLGSKNREFLIFLFFLVLSSGFWLMITLNEQYETEISVPVQYTDVPGNVVMTGASDDTITVRVQDRRFVLMSYTYDDISPIKVDFKACSSPQKGIGILKQTEIIKQLHSIFSNSTKVVNVKPETVRFYYNYGERKKVPVKAVGNISAAGSYYISNIKYKPDSVIVYAQRNVLDSIKYVNTIPLNYPSIKDTLFIDAQLEKIEGAKCVPAKVKMGIYTDILTEETFEVPITALNVPEGKLVRTFPMRVNVTFIVGAGMVRNLNPSKFEVVVDYNEIIKHPDDKCTLTLKKYPHGIKRPRLQLDKVDYIIEQSAVNLVE